MSLRNQFRGAAGGTKDCQLVLIEEIQVPQPGDSVGSAVSQERLQRGWIRGLTLAKSDNHARSPTAAIHSIVARSPGSGKMTSSKASKSPFQERFMILSRSEKPQLCNLSFMTYLQRDVHNFRGNGALSFQSVPLLPASAQAFSSAVHLPDSCRSQSLAHGGESDSSSYGNRVS
jgi:hypothetical protein